MHVHPRTCRGRRFRPPDRRRGGAGGRAWGRTRATGRPSGDGPVRSSQAKGIRADPRDHPAMNRGRRGGCRTRPPRCPSSWRAGSVENAAATARHSLARPEHRRWAECCRWLVAASSARISRGTLVRTPAGTFSTDPAGSETWRGTGDRPAAASCEANGRARDEPGREGAGDRADASDPVVGRSPGGEGVISDVWPGEDTRPDPALRRRRRFRGMRPGTGAKSRPGGLAVPHEGVWGTVGLGGRAAPRAHPMLFGPLAPRSLDLATAFADPPPSPPARRRERATR